VLTKGGGDSTKSGGGEVRKVGGEGDGQSKKEEGEIDIGDRNEG